jgi:hypothetical protein
MICLIPAMINPASNAVPAAPSDEAEMHIDEESRPRFPPSSQTVGLHAFPFSNIRPPPNLKSEELPSHLTV